MHEDLSPFIKTPRAYATPIQERSSRIAKVPVLFAILLTSALLLRLIGLTRLEVWRDEALTLVMVRASWRDLLCKLPWSEDSPPLGFLIYKLWLTGGTSELHARMLPVLFGVATVGIMMLQARRVSGASAWAVGLLAASAFELLCYHQEIRVYAAFTCVIAACFHAVDRAAVSQSPVARYAPALWAAVAAHLHVVGLLFCPALVMYSAVRMPPQKAFRLWWRGPAILWAFLASPIFFFSIYWTRFRREAGFWWVAPPSVRDMRDNLASFIGITTLREWATSRIATVGQWGGFAMERWILFGVAGLLVAGLLDSERRRIVAALLASWATFFASLLMTSWLTLPNILPRTLVAGWIPILLALSLGAGAGARRILQRVTWVAVAGIAFIWAVSWIWLSSYGFPRHDRDAPIWAWMRERVSRNDLIVSWRHDFEDLTVYRLSENICADQLFTDEFPVYEGCPPRPVLEPRRPDPGWRLRVRTALEEKERAGRPYQVWIVQRGTTGADLPDAPDRLLDGAYAFKDGQAYPTLLGTSIRLYVPCGLRTRAEGSVPATAPAYR